MDLTRPLWKTTLVTSAILAAVVWACSGHVAAARGQNEATSRPAQERGGNNAADPTLHLTGCVERGVIPGSFMLTQVRVAGTDAVAGHRAGPSARHERHSEWSFDGSCRWPTFGNSMPKTIRTVAGTCSPATDRR